MADEIHRITKETLEKLQAEYLYLTTVGRTEIARTIESARLLGDLSENGDYHAAKDEQGKMEARIRQIDQVIRNHEIVARDEHAGKVQHASIAKVVYEGDADDDKKANRLQAGKIHRVRMAGSSRFSRSLHTTELEPPLFGQRHLEQLLWKGLVA